MKTVAILHGWAGGSWHTKEFSRALADKGFKVIKDPSKADIIIAHSAGCYRLPQSLQASLAMIIGAPYWPDKSVIRRALKKKNTDWIHTRKAHGTVYATKKSIWELIYVIVKPAVTLVAVLNYDKLGFLDKLRNCEVIVVRNQDDYFCSPDIKQAIKKHSNASYVVLPGEHDDYYTNPKPYIDLILKHYN